MATTSLHDSAIESRVPEQHDATLQFQRLERVRARQRSRRGRVKVTTLGMALAGLGVLGFIVVRGTSFERLGQFRAQARASMPAQGAVSTPAGDSALSPTSAAVPLPARADESTLMPPQAQAAEVKSDVTLDVKPFVAQAYRIQANSSPADGLKSLRRALSTRVVVPGGSAQDRSRSNQLPDRQAGGVTDPSRPEQSAAEVVDPAAVIDWLLKTSPTRSE
jgi:cytoskeletal protein RodZ